MALRCTTFVLGFMQVLQSDRHNAHCTLAVTNVEEKLEFLSKTFRVHISVRIMAKPNDVFVDLLICTR